MNIIGNLPNTVKSNADKLGYLAALLGSDSTGWNRLNAVISSVQQLAAGVIHLPDFQHEIQNFMNYEGKQALMLWIAGLGLDLINLPIVGKVGKPLQEGAQAYAIASAAVRLLYGATHSEIKGTNIEQGQSKFLAQAPTYNY